LWTVIYFSIRESHELSGNQGGQILKENGSPFSERPSLFGKTVAFLFVVGRSRSHTSEEEVLRTFTVCEVVDEAVPVDARPLLAKSMSAVEYRKGLCPDELLQPI